MPAKAANGSSPPPISIIFPELPYVELRPNYSNRKNFFKKAECIKIAREEAYLLGLDVVPPHPIEMCEIEEVFTVPTRARRDIENFMAGCKAWLDGIHDAGIIAEDDWHHVRRLSGGVVYKKNVAQTEIIVRPIS